MHIKWNNTFNLDTDETSLVRQRDQRCGLWGTGEPSSAAAAQTPRPLLPQPATRLEFESKPYLLVPVAATALMLLLK